jgi:hypothetical protein
MGWLFAKSKHFGSRETSLTKAPRRPPLQGRVRSGSGDPNALKEACSTTIAESVYPPANFFFATGRANAFVGPCPLFARIFW